MVNSPTDSLNKKRPSIGSALVGGTVVLEVGPDRVKYCVHKALLAHHSEYFRNALKGPWKEAEEGVFRLEDVSPPAVNVFVHWPYTQHLPNPEDESRWWDMAGDSVDEHIAVSQVKAYVFADRFMAYGFQRVINNLIIGRFGGNSLLVEVNDMLTLVEEASKNIPSNRPIWQFLVDEYCEWSEVHCGDTDAISKLPHKFVVRAMRRLAELLFEERTGRTKQARCYREHADEMEVVQCGAVHMRYNKEEDFGFFGDEILCVMGCGGVQDCICGPASASSSSESESDSD